jgi:Ca2+-transporting ATPase
MYQKLQGSNPMGAALISSAEKGGLNTKDLSSYTLVDEFSFDNSTKMASYVYEWGDTKIIYSSGAPEAIIGKSTKILIKGKEVDFTSSERKKVAEAIAEVASNGERTLCIAYALLGKMRNVRRS